MPHTTPTRHCEHHLAQTVTQRPRGIITSGVSYGEGKGLYLGRQGVRVYQGACTAAACPASGRESRNLERNTSIDKLSAPTRVGACFRGALKVKCATGSMGHLATPSLLLCRRCEEGQLGLSIIVHARLVHIIWVGMRGLHGTGFRVWDGTYLAVMPLLHPCTCELVIDHHTEW